MCVANQDSLQRRLSDLKPLFALALRFSKVNCVAPLFACACMCVKNGRWCVQFHHLCPDRTLSGDTDTKGSMRPEDVLRGWGCA